MCVHLLLLRVTKWSQKRRIHIAVREGADVVGRVRLEDDADDGRSKLYFSDGKSESEGAPRPRPVRRLVFCISTIESHASHSDSTCYVSTLSTLRPRRFRTFPASLHRLFHPLVSSTLVSSHLF